MNAHIKHAKIYFRESIVTRIGTESWPSVRVTQAIPRNHFCLSRVSVGSWIFPQSSLGPARFLPSNLPHHLRWVYSTLTYYFISLIFARTLSLLILKYTNTTYTYYLTFKMSTILRIEFHKVSKVNHTSTYLFWHV